MDGVAERVGHAVVHEHRGQALDEALDEEREATLDRRRLGAHEERRELGDDEHERGVLHRRLRAPARP